MVLVISSRVSSVDQPSPYIAFSLSIFLMSAPSTSAPSPLPAFIEPPSFTHRAPSDPNSEPVVQSTHPFTQSGDNMRQTRKTAYAMRQRRYRTNITTSVCPSPSFPLLVLSASRIRAWTRRWLYLTVPRLMRRFGQIGYTVISKSKEIH